MNQNDTRKQFKERLGVSEWGEAEPGEANVFFLNFLLTGQELSDWALVRARRPIHEEGVTARKWFWEPSSNRDGNFRLYLETFECPSQGAAHDQVVSLLGHVQGPQLSRLRGGPGDVSFGPEDGYGPKSNYTTVIMARGNLALRFLNAGDDIVGVRALAEELDDVLQEPPASRKDVPGPRFERAKLEVRNAYQALLVNAVDPIEDEVSFRIFSTGQISRVDGDLRYDSPPNPPYELRVFALNQVGGVSKRIIDGREE